MKEINLQLNNDEDQRGFTKFFLLNNRFSAELLSAVFFLSFVVLVRYHWKRRDLYRISSQLPGPTALPILGNALLFAVKFTDIFHAVDKVITENQSPFRIWIGPYLYVVLKNPEDIQVILSDPEGIYKDPIMRFCEPFIGKGLVSGSGPLWKMHRKMITPTFNMKILEKYIDVFNEKSKTLTENIQKEIKNHQEIDIMEFLGLCTVDILCSTVMGAESNAQNKENNDLVKTTEQMYHFVHERLFKVWLHPDFVYKLTPQWREISKNRHIIDNFINKLIQDKKNEFQDKSVEEQEEMMNKRSLTTLEQLIIINRDGKYFNESELKDEIYTIFTAGQDTTAVIGAFSILMLAMHPEVQDKVYAEIENVLGTTSSVDISPDAYQNLKYLEMVFKETIRLFPIAPLMVRRMTHETKLEKCTLPKECGVVISMYHTHRNPELFDRANEFYPEHFLPENVAKRHPFAFIGFSWGQRGCVGQKYAMLCMKTMVVHLLRSFRFTSDLKYSDLKITSDISVRSMSGYHVRVHPR